MNFTSTRSDADWRPRLAVYGDMGTASDGGNARSLPFLIEEAEAGVYDAALHIGDFAYNMHDNNGSRGDDFMNDIQPIASRVPYMTCPGNHEAAYNFSNYINRFTMPGYENDQANMFYSWNIGPFHVISIAVRATVGAPGSITFIMRPIDRSVLLSLVVERRATPIRLAQGRP